jgi:hypothetical protein
VLPIGWKKCRIHHGFGCVASIRVLRSTYVTIRPAISVIFLEDSLARTIITHSGSTCTFVIAAKTYPRDPLCRSVSARPRFPHGIPRRPIDGLDTARRCFCYRYDPRSLHRPPSGVTPPLTRFRHRRRVHFETEPIGFDPRSRPPPSTRVSRCLKRNRAYNRQGHSIPRECLIRRLYYDLSRDKRRCTDEDRVPQILPTRSVFIFRTSRGLLPKIDGLDAHDTE